MNVSAMCVIANRGKYTGFIS